MAKETIYFPFTLTAAELQDFRAGSDAVFDKVWNRLKGQIYVHVTCMVKVPEQAEGITVEAFVKVWERRRWIQSADHLLNLLFVISRDLCVADLRKQWSREPSEEVRATLATYQTMDIKFCKIHAELVERLSNETRNLLSRLNETAVRKT
jgi:DNA-directed RNA polymerase specialized sigma24 family protein